MAVTDGDHLPPPQAPNGVPFLVISDVNTGRISFEKARFVSDEYYKSLPEIRKAQEGDLLFTVTGSYGIVIPVTTNRDFCFQRHIGLIKTITSSTWIRFVLQSNYVQSYCDSIATGTAQKTVSLGHLRNLLVPIPPENEQKRIICEIEVWLNKVHNIQKSKCDLEHLLGFAKSKILELAISGKLVPQDPSDEPAEELLRRINPSAVPADKSHYQHLPKGWCLTSMNYICQLYDGERKTGDKINLDAKFLRGRSEGTILNSGRFVHQNTTMILVDGENSGEIFTAPIDGYQGSTFKLLNINSEMNVDYVKMIIRIYQKRLRDNKVGSAIPHLNKKMFKAIEVPVPPIKEQARIVEKVFTLFSHIKALSECL